METSFAYVLGVFGVWLIVLTVMALTLVESYFELKRTVNLLLDSLMTTSRIQGDQLKREETFSDILKTLLKTAAEKDKESEDE